MKNIILILGVLFYSAIASAQYTEADLEGKEWITNEENNFYKLLNIKRVFINNILYETVEVKGDDASESEQKYDWYLSNSIEESFDKTKIGKNTIGKYLHIKNFNNSVLICEIIELTSNKMIILPITSKNHISIASGSNPPIVFIRNK